MGTSFASNLAVWYLVRRDIVYKQGYAARLWSFWWMLGFNGGGKFQRRKNVKFYWCGKFIIHRVPASPEPTWQTPAGMPGGGHYLFWSFGQISTIVVHRPTRREVRAALWSLSWLCGYIPCVKHYDSGCPTQKDNIVEFLPGIVFQVCRQSWFHIGLPSTGWDNDSWLKQPGPHLTLYGACGFSMAPIPMHSPMSPGPLARMISPSDLFFYKSYFILWLHSKKTIKKPVPVDGTGFSRLNFPALSQLQPCKASAMESHT